MDTVDFIWMDGEFIPWDSAKIHVLSHSLHYGTGVYEGIRFYETENGKTAVFRLKEHIDRLYISAKALNIEIPYKKEVIHEAALENIRKNKIKSGYIRPIVFYGYGKMGLMPQGAKLNVCIAVWPWGSYLGEDLVRVKTVSIIKMHPNSTVTTAKICGHYANSLQAKHEAIAAGYDEALLLDYKGNIAEGPVENIFMVKDNKLITPKGGNILEGITRDSIMKIAQDSNIEVIEKDLILDDLLAANEAFFTGTAAEVSGIKQINDVMIGKGDLGPISQKLKAIYTDVIHGKIDQYSDWLTYV
ncbi:branched-chain amino acid transaminase [Patescibacteria group bacterium]